MAKAIEIVADFTGYPDDTEASMRSFRAGETLDDLPDAFADMIVKKGLAREAAPDAKGNDKGEKDA